MKKIITILTVVLLSFSFCISNAQTHYLFGTCYSGGSTGYGTIFRADLDGSNLHDVHLFQDTDGAKPWGKIAQASNGNIYGVTYLGGCSDSCVLFEYNPNTGTCFDVYDFYCSGPGGEPSNGGICISSDGNLYGLQQNGILYKFDPNTHIYTLLNNTSGISYQGGVIKGTDNALYGVSDSGGVYGYGTIFKYDISSNTYSTIYSLDSTHGRNPMFGTLIEATDGKLYGTTGQGGATDNGVIFSYDRALNTYNDLYDFDGTHGKYPYSGLMQGTDGKLYGMASSGGGSSFGTIYSYDIPTAQYTVIHNFDGTNGSQPMGALFQASNGILYGTTYLGGTFNWGTAFSYNLATNNFSVLANFDATSGNYPQSDFMEATVLTTGIATEDVSSLTIAPNPTTTSFTITSSSKIETITITDVLGQSIEHLTINNNQSTINISQLPSGIYFLSIQDQNKNIINRKIIKQ